MNQNNIPTLRLGTDTDCVLYIDGVKKMQMVKGMTHELPLPAGKYLLNFVSLENQDDNRLVEYKMPSKDVEYEVRFQGKVKTPKKVQGGAKRRNILLWIIVPSVFITVLVFLLMNQKPSRVEKEEPEMVVSLDEIEMDDSGSKNVEVAEEKIESNSDNNVAEGIDNTITKKATPAVKSVEPRENDKDEVKKIEKYYKSGKYSDCLPLAKKYANKGYAEAQFYLANMYRRGYGVKKDTAAALMWYHKAAAQNHPIAQCSIGYFYNFGYGVPQDYCEAVKWYRKSADQGYAIAQCDLAICYEYGDCVEKNYYEAKKWYQKAANQGDKVSKDALTRIQMKIEGRW